MHSLQILINTTFVIYLFFALTVILIFPLFLSTQAILDLKGKRLYYSIKLFSKIKLNCGFVVFTRKRAVIKYKKNKRKSFFYKDVVKDKTNAKALKSFIFIKINSAICLGGENSFEKLTLSYLLNGVQAILYSVLKEVKPKVKLKNDVILLDENHGSGAVASISAVINLLGLAVIFIRKLYGGIVNYVKGKKRQQN